MTFIKFLITHNIFLLKLFLLKLINNYKVYHKWGLLLTKDQIIRNTKNITIGSKFGMGYNCQLFAQGDPGNAEIIIGNNVAMNFNVMINADCGGKIIIDDHVRIGPYTVMRASNHKFDDINSPIYTQGHEPGEIVIEEDVWLGAHVTILRNVRIGRSSVIGAGSVVTSDIPPFSIAAGVPAKVIMNRK